MAPDDRQESHAHQCSVCTALSQGFGPVARVATSWDGALLSVLWEAQLPGQAEPPQSPVPPFRTHVVPDPAGAGRRFARDIAMLTAWAKVEDGLADGDAWWVRVPGLARWVRRRAERAQRGLSDLGFDARPHLEAISHHSTLEQGTHSLDDRCAPVEEAYAAAFAHTAHLSRTPQNANSLRDMGRAYGRLTYLADAARDMRTDRRRGQPNLLLDCLGLERAESALPSLAGEAWQRLGTALDRLRIARHADLLGGLLVHRAPYRLPRRKPRQPALGSAGHQGQGVHPEYQRGNGWCGSGDRSRCSWCAFDCCSCSVYCVDCCCCTESCPAVACCCAGAWAVASGPGR